MLTVDLNRTDKKFRQTQPSGRSDIPPPHLHMQTHLFQERTNEVQSQFVNHTSTGDGCEHFDHFVSEHEIKFTRNEVCTPFTCICLFIAFLFSFMAILSGIYYGCMYSLYFLFMLFYSS